MPPRQVSGPRLLRSKKSGAISLDHVPALDISVRQSIGMDDELSRIAVAGHADDDESGSADAIEMYEAMRHVRAAVVAAVLPVGEHGET